LASVELGNSASGSARLSKAELFRLLKGRKQMKRRIAIVMCTAVLGLTTLSSHVMAQQKTVKTCQDEWKANKAANKANGITEKAYVAECRGGATAAQPAAAPAAPPAAAPAAAATGKKTAKACHEEWRANKAANETNGISEKAYVAKCRGVAASTQTTVAPPAPTPTAAPAAPPPTPTTAAPPAKPVTSATSTVRPAPTATPQPVGANEFSTEAQAKARCPSDTVVWVNLTSKIYHFSGTKNYGNTKKGAYMCERDTAAAGMRASKNETHP